MKILPKAFYVACLLNVILTILLAYKLFSLSKTEHLNCFNENSRSLSVVGSHACPCGTNTVIVSQLKDKISNLTQLNKQLKNELEDSKLELEEVHEQLISLHKDYFDVINKMNP
jgi:hypothetical protein